MTDDPNTRTTGPERYFLRTVSWSPLFVKVCIAGGILVLLTGLAQIGIGFLDADEFLRAAGALIAFGGTLILVQMTAVIGAQRHLRRNGMMPPKNP